MTEADRHALAHQMDEYAALAAEVADPDFLQRYAELKAENADLRDAVNELSRLYFEAKAELERLAKAKAEE